MSPAVTQVPEPGNLVDEVVFDDLQGLLVEGQVDSDNGEDEEGDDEEDVPVNDAVPSRIGKYRVTTPEEIRDFLRKSINTSGPLPDQSEPFNEGALACGLTSAQRKWVLEHCQRLGYCKICQKDAGACAHFPSSNEKLEDSRLIEIPVVFEGKDTVVTLVLVPGDMLLREYARDATILKSLISEPQERSADARGNSSFCAGEFFQGLIAVVPKQSIPLVLGLYSDGTTVVSFGTRSLHVASMCILNTTLPTAQTIRPMMFIPSVAGLELSVAKRRLLRQLVFNACWEAACQTLHVQVQDSTIDCVSDGKLVSLYPTVGLFLADSVEQNKVLSHRHGGLTAEICGRCRATSNDNDLKTFALKMDRKSEIDALLARIVARDDIGDTRRELQQQSQLESWSFADSLRHFDAALCSPTCSLHTGQLLWSKTLLELIGSGLVRPDAPTKPKRGRPKQDMVEHDAIKNVNAQFRRFGWKFDLFDGDGSLSIGLKTGDVLFDVIMDLPFTLFNVLDEEFQLFLDAAIAWRSCLIVWFERGKSKERLEVRREMLDGLFSVRFVVFSGFVFFFG